MGAERRFLAGTYQFVTSRPHLITLYSLPLLPSVLWPSFHVLGMRQVCA